MASIVPGYEYDIFISYRHNDNLDSWVTDFVQNLEKELRSTLKETVTIYFDRNPHDGLLETHHVDKSLEGKLKCLIFIPIISQTYCDPKSFAWQHEFCAFNKLAKDDQVGRDIKLSSGNVASRILSIKIHDLDAEDKLTIENEISGVLRSIEFIFKSAGVNRPLRSQEDHPQDNLNKTFYRDQLNKVANAIKEIITSLKNPATQPIQETNNQPRKAKTNKRPLIAILSVILLAAVVAYIFYPKLSQADKQVEALDRSIAVLPFVDLSESKDQSWFSDGLTEEILNSLAHVNGLQVISRTSSFAFKNKNLRIQAIADSLGVNYVVEGSVRKSGDELRITAQLIRANDGFHIWSNTYDRSVKDIFVLQQEIASKIAKSLDISLDPKSVEHMQRAGTNSPEAFVAFLKGQEIFFEAHVKRNELLPLLKKANLDFDDAIRLDPDFINPYLYKGDFYFHYLLKNERVIFNDAINDAQAYQQMKQSIENAIAKSKSEVEKDYYRLYLIIYSNDWSSLKPTVERVLNRPEAVQLFNYQPFNLTALLTCLGYGPRIIELNREILKSDPLNRNRKREIVDAFMFSGDYDQSIESIDSMNALNEDFRLNEIKIVNLFRLKKFDEANSLFMQLDSGAVSCYRSTQAMLLAQKGELKEAKLAMDRDSRVDYNLEGIEAAYGREAANKQASQLDKKLVMHHILLFSYLHSPKKLPFDLSSTPNFVKRFRTAGVVIE